MEKFKLGWFSTGRDEAARELIKVVLKDIEHEVIPNCDISFVFCSREEGESKESDKFIKLVRERGIPLVCFSSAKFMPEFRKKGLEQEKKGNTRLIEDWRFLYDREVMNRLYEKKHDLIVLAGYMLVAGREMCVRYKMINLHPARPGGPKGSWQEVIRQLILNRAEKTGVMMHLVTPDLDEGPPVTFCVFKIKNGILVDEWKEIENIMREDPDFIKGGVKAVENTSLFKKIREKGLEREFPLISYTIRVFAQGKVKIKAGQVVNSRDKVLTAGYDLTEIIDKKTGGSSEYNEENYSL